MIMVLLLANLGDGFAEISKWWDFGVGIAVDVVVEMMRFADQDFLVNFGIGGGVEGIEEQRLRYLWCAIRG